MSRAELIAACRAQSPGWPTIEHECWADARCEVDPVVFDLRHPMHGAWQRELPKVKCPLLLITGEPARGSLVSPDAAAALAGDCKSGRYVTIPGAGHSVHRDRHQEFMRVVRSFLASPQARI